MTCPSCGTRHWRNAKPCAGALVVSDGAVLLVRRAIAPWRGAWDIPGGFCDPDEHPARAAEREVREETGLTVQVEAFLGMWMDVYADGRYEETTLNCYFTAVPVGAVQPVTDPAEVLKLGWFRPDALPEELAFPAHAGQVLAVWRDLTGGAG